MPKRLFALFAAAIGLTASQVASAADLGRPLPPAPIYIPPAPVPYLWTGCYVGGNVAGAWSNVEVSNVATSGTASASNSGVAGGGQIGCDYQAGAWVVGVRNMFDGTSLSGSGTLSSIPFTGTASSRTNWFDTLTLRGGYLVAPSVLLYAQGGAAWTNTNVTFFNSNGAQAGELSNKSYRLDSGRPCRMDVRAALVGICRIQFHGFRHTKCGLYGMWDLCPRCQSEHSRCFGRREL